METIIEVDSRDFDLPAQQEGDDKEEQAIRTNGKNNRQRLATTNMKPNSFPNREEYFDDDDDDDDDTTGCVDGDDTQSASHKNRDNNNLALELARTETRAVRCLRIVVVSVLLACGVAMAVCVHRYTSRQEETKLSEAFDDYARRIIDTVDLYAQHKLEALGALALLVQAHAIVNKNNNDINNTNTGGWPFVTVPFFEEHVQATRSLTDAYGILLFPIVSESQRAAYEAYTVNHVDWIWDAYAAQRSLHHGRDELGIDDFVWKRNNDTTTNNNTSSSSSSLAQAAAYNDHLDWFDFLWTADYRNESNPDFSSGIAHRIFTTSSSPDVYHPVVMENNSNNTTTTTTSTSTTTIQQSSASQERIYIPQWQAAPMNAYYQSTVNLDYSTYDDFAYQTEIIRNTSNAAFGIAWDDQSTEGYVSTLLYPIFDKFHNDNNDNNNNDGEENQDTDPTTNSQPQGQKQVVAFLGLDIYWKAFLENILPPETPGMYVVVNNSCGQVFSFLLQGDAAEFVGDGDVVHAGNETTIFRDGREMKRTTVFGQKLMEPVSEPTYTGPPLYGDFCTSTFSIYPTADMYDAYITREPIFFSAGALCILLFTSAVFILYDCLVERRQRLVMTTATRADKVVSSLFPEHVKERLYEDSCSHHNNNNNSRHPSESSVTKNAGPREFMGIKNPITTTSSSTNTAVSKTTLSAKDTAFDKINPIANLYPEATVLFADLVGFTSWSSGRAPSDVFLLLETLYGSFDAIAKRRKVFKVETIGDCYVAATGIPKAQDNHALIMTRFAQDCMVKMKVELEILNEQLGGSTLHLAMRVGLHSGAIVAGVLRGEKSRFQLFGDTMNTAARMESNGSPNRIHISESTAELLREAGKGHWIQERSDRIVAKGKGEMRTFWVDIRNTAGSQTSATQRTDDGESQVGGRDNPFNLALDESNRGNYNDDDAEDIVALEKKIQKRLSPR